MKIALISLMLMGLAQCSEQPAVTTDPAESIVIRSGTSFGMCIGYCTKDMELVGTKAMFTKNSFRDPAKYPTRTCTKMLTESKAANLNSLARFNEFRKQPEVIGCPDCADGGAEYIEIQVGEVRHRVKFEYGKTIPGFEILVKELRVQRDLFNDCE